MKKLIIKLPVLMIVILNCLPALSSETMEQRNERMKWWREARFGMFIHWGLYAIPAGEWKGKEVPNIGEWIMNFGQIPVEEYEPLTKQFNPVKFNAKEWVSLAKGAGMKYIVITSKHHDGFCMFDSNMTDYDVVDASPYGKDILKQLSDECHKQGIKMCWYHSIMDWHHPDYLPRRAWEKRSSEGADLNRYIDYMKGQLKELLTNYGEIGVLWFDGGWEHNTTELRSQEVVDMIRGIQPKIIINNRINLPQDYETPEQFIPVTGIPGRDWETCMTMNDTWGYKKNDHNWKSTEDLIRKLVDIASKGGNFLLNVGPKADGTIPQESVERLKEIGKWMNINGESIYGTGPSVFKNLSWGRCTTKKEKLYLHVFDWPADSKLIVPGLENKFTKAYLLEDKPESLSVSKDENNVIINVPSQAPDEVDTVVVLEIVGEPQVVAQTIRQKEDGSVELKAIDAAIFGTTARYESGNGKDNIGYWTNLEDYVAWDFVINRPGIFNVEITYACDRGVGGSEYSIEINEQKIKGKITDTDSWTNFKTEKISSVRVDKEGKYTLLVKPETKPGLAVMNLKSVMLSPADVN